MFDTKNTIISFDYQGPEREEILRNLATLYSIVEGTAPMARSFGLSHEYLDYPIPIAKNMIALDVVEKTDIYEPRVRVMEVSFIQDTNGALTPKVTIAKSEHQEEGGV